MTTEAEKLVLAHLGIAWDAFLKLDDKHPDDLLEFRMAIHQAQALIAWRVARLVDPETWGGSNQSKGS